MPGPGWIGSTTVRNKSPGREHASNPNAAAVAEQLRMAIIKAKTSILFQRLKRSGKRSQATWMSQILKILFAMHAPAQAHAAACTRQIQWLLRLRHWV